MLDRIIFLFGGLVFVMFFAGLIFTVREFRKMGETPEKYTPEPWFTGPKKRTADD